MEWKQKSRDKVSLFSCLTSDPAFIENSSCAWKSFTPVFNFLLYHCRFRVKGVSWVCGCGGRGGDVWSRAGQRAPPQLMRHRSDSRYRGRAEYLSDGFFSLLVDRDTEGCFRTRHPKKNQSLHWCCCQSCAPQNHDTQQQFDSDCALTVCSVWTRLLLWIDPFQLDSWNLARHFVLC